ncbi:hypothetical protein ABT390_16740 [Streptomyces aurantiacus]|uniref:Uncharacterized protein n=1 Tax=Streptomyces aurantiacus JA 4570 TaxID=1286094 RepID=S3ZNI6_9ACTN|nr:hypothetical protein [Streptomyces aurantiacus]EPH44753.1 hypothetical protein STRAU_2193 [Streptomyces aurantiacus JA 4570]
MSSDDRPPSGGGAHVQINAVHGGSLAFGDHGTAESTNFTTVVADRAHGDLLTAVRALRSELSAGERTAAEGEVVAQLDEIEGEITRTGRSSRGLLVRVRDRLAENAPATATAAAVATVVQAIAEVLA